MFRLFTLQAALHHAATRETIVDLSRGLECEEERARGLKRALATARIDTLAKYLVRIQTLEMTLADLLGSTLETTLEDSLATRDAENATLGRAPTCLLDLQSKMKTRNGT